MNKRSPGQSPPPEMTEERKAYIQGNAVTLVGELEAKVYRQAKRINALEQAVQSLRRELQRSRAAEGSNDANE
jgi:hypothetical protein